MSTAHNCLNEFMDAILAVKNDIIKMPSTEIEYRGLANDFYRYKYPNVIGAIDGTSIDVIVPEEHRIDYFTRKYKTSVNLTAVCDANKRYWYIIVGYSGRCHDAHIFNCSGLARAIHVDKVFPPDYHLLGDAAYGLHMNMMCPYAGENLTAAKEAHNYTHSATRMVVERSFSDLKSRWLRLQTMRNDLELVNRIIATCCCLHNISLDYGDIDSTDQPVGLEGNRLLDCATATTKRDYIATLILDSTN